MSISERLMMHSNHIKDDACYSLNMQLMREAVQEIKRLREALRYVLEDESNFVPRASSSCRAVVREALDA